MSKNSRLKYVIIIIGTAIIIAILPLFHMIETHSCLCSSLSSYEQRKTIDDRLGRIIDLDSLNPGTFSYITTTCEHGARIQLRVFPDENYYLGRLLKP